MTTHVKTPRRFKLQEDEQDSLLAGVDFQVHYLGSKELVMADHDIDDVIADAYSRYLTNADLQSTSTRLAITVDTHQLVFFNVIRNETEFIIAVSNIKAVHSGTKRTKFANAIILLTYVTRGNAMRAYVFHCPSQRKAKELYGAINRSFQYNVTENSLTDDQDKMSRELLTKELSKKTKNLKFGPGPSQDRSDSNPIAVLGYDAKGTRDSSQEAERARDKGRPKLTTQTRGAEGLGLLENIDADDDEFTNLARSRTISDTFKWFGR